MKSPCQVWYHTAPVVPLTLSEHAGDLAVLQGVDGVVAVERIGVVISGGAW